MKNKLSYGQIILLGFVAVILTGTLLLCLPVASQNGQSVGFVDALFTSASATCVTGLVAVDTGTHWTLFGQLVILTMIQVGGLGFVAFSALLSMMLHKKISLGRRELMQQSIGGNQVGGIVRIFRLAIFGTLIIEGIGAVLLMVRFVPQYGAVGVWYGIFHSISAFCNAGFDLFGREITPFTSLTSYANDPYVCFVIMALIVVGGLGFFVWEDIKTKGFAFHKYRLHSKLVLSFTAFLLVAPAVLFYLWEQNGALASLSGFDRVVGALFQSVTCRTAGFNTVDMAALSDQSVMLSAVLMFIGGSSGSTAGGIKTTTMLVSLLAVVSMLFKRSSITVFGRRLEKGLLMQAHSIIFVYMAAVVGGVTALCCLEPCSIRDALFEVTSAVATVGLTTGITQSLGVGSKLLLAVLMLFGRVGGLSMVMALTGALKSPPVEYPEEKISVG